MNTDLQNLYRELEEMPQSAEVKKLRKNIEKKLNDKLRMNFLEIIDMGAIVGFEQLEKQLLDAAGLVSRMKKKK
ncbi:MAG: hypothetical protein MUC87_01080 [Bacteroidia bacterium]|jgi:hypothetical protein|nr:hypothetical protein [Bacteroidia bacterium]